jgi:predicted alpha/beta-fold hydrolase
MLTADSFRPGLLIQNGQVQTILASSPLRAWGKNPMLAATRETILETPAGIRLLGAYSSRKSNHSKGRVILLHGWEGSIDSTYIVCTGNTLYQSGYDVFRLNFRDHGNSYHLNQGIFYAVLLDEVFQAVQQISHDAGNKPVFLVGFSLGGNFALRIAQKMLETPIANLYHVVAISPVLNPEQSTVRVDQNPLIRRYFLKKWRHSLNIKQKLFPDVYDFTAALRLKTIRAVTDQLLSEYSGFNSAREYFRGYSVLKDAIKHLSVATTIITARDDPIIPVDDFYRLVLNENTNRIIHNFGGHNGFIDGFRLKSWYEEKLANLFDEIVMAFHA